MTISFMVLGGPRSATTWLSNLLTTDKTLCLHDPLIQYTPNMLDGMYFPGKTRVGISDTAALLWPEWINTHPAKKVILWRDPGEINASLKRLGLHDIHHQKHILRIESLVPKVRMYPWDSVFRVDIASEICKYFDVPFCPYRHEELTRMNVQPHVPNLLVGKEAGTELARRLTEEFKQ